MTEEFKRIADCVSVIRKATDFTPETALVLGSGLGNFADEIEVECEIPYGEIPGFCVSTAPGHDGRLIFGMLDGVRVVCMKGRVHFYEGYSMEEIVRPVRTLRLLGARVLFLTNAAGGIADGFKAGDLMLITDHISSLIKSPLIGENIDELGVRFPDMSEVYDRRLREIIKKSAAECGISLKEGVYIQTTGPNYETPAEIRAYKALGADAVGMSTVCEAIAANHMGFKICAVSCISNLAAGISRNPLAHEEVKETAERVAESFKALVKTSVINISRELEND